MDLIGFQSDFAHCLPNLCSPQIALYRKVSWKYSRFQ